MYIFSVLAASISQPKYVHFFGQIHIHLVVIYVYCLCTSSIEFIVAVFD